MNAVFEETKLAGITLKNRIIRSATHEGLSDENGKPTEASIRKFEQLARGGVGAIITGYVGIMPNGKSPALNMAMIDSDDLIDAYRELTARVHACQTPIILEIAHCGRQTRSKITGYPTVAPSPIRDMLYIEDKPHELTDQEITEIIENFVAAVERSKKAGFDGVQLHLAHGYLLSSFLSPHMNRRTDRWGGSIENRFRIVREILRKSRELVGDYPILTKINAFEKSQNGLKTAEAVEIAKYLYECGCDAIEVSSGIVEDGFWVSRGMVPMNIIKTENFFYQKIPALLRPLARPVLKKKMTSPEPYHLYNLEAAKRIKRQIGIPVIVVGGIRKLEEIQGIIEKGQCDYVSMARPFIIEPDIVNKFKSGQQLESKCINCNFCVIGIDARPLKCYYGKINK
jgi:2,4-dienoyl-CoA reductase-like NADH-dependent reductase (Old Yellow Enzyme family)